MKLKNISCHLAKNFIQNPNETLDEVLQSFSKIISGISDINNKLFQCISISLQKFSLWYKKQSSVVNQDVLSELLDELDNQDRLELRSIPHGLWIDQPLVVNEIIYSCFQNRDRRRFCGRVLAEKGWHGCQLSPETVTAETIIHRTLNQIPACVEAFNQASISLQNKYRLNDAFLSATGRVETDKDRYVETIKASKWYGPYQDDTDGFYFFSLNDAGSNEYLAIFHIYLDQPLGWIDLFQCFKGYEIAMPSQFSIE